MFCIDVVSYFTNKESVEHLLRVQCERPLLSQPGLSRIGHHDQSSAHRYSILDYQRSGPAQERKAVVDVAERRHPARRRRDEKGERHDDITNTKNPPSADLRWPVLIRPPTLIG